MYWCESQTIKKAEHQKIDAFKLCWNCKVKPVSPKGNQPWWFIGRTKVEAEAPILWLPDVKSWLTEKDPDDGKGWKQKKRGNRAWGGQIASLTWWMRIWVNSGRQWKTEEPGVCRPWVQEKVRHYLATEQQQ